MPRCPPCPVWPGPGATDLSRGRSRHEGREPPVCPQPPTTPGTWCQAPLHRDRPQGPMCVCEWYVPMCARVYMCVCGAPCVYIGASVCAPVSVFCAYAYV